MAKFLIVDDHETNLYMLRTLLEGCGHQVVEAFNGAEALALAREEPPDVVISDLLMPVMDGFTFCHEWKKDAVLRAVPFVVYTATYTEAKDEETALKAGADRFLRKPTEPDQFMAVMAEVLASLAGTQARASEWHNDGEAFKLYNQRLIHKLEKKMIDLEREVDERRRAELALRASEATLARAQEIAHVGDWTWQQSSDALRWSAEAARIVGLDTERRTGTLADWLERVHAEDRDDVRSAFEQTAGGGHAMRVEHRIVRPDGSARVVYELAESVAVGDDLVGTIQDITERTRLENQLHQAQKLEAVGHVAGEVAHDFSNMLQAILSHVEAVMSTLPADDDRHQELAKAATAAEHAGVLIRQLLAFGRRQRLATVVLDLNQLIGQVLALIDRAIGADIVVRFEPAASLQAIVADPSQLERVLLNLCVNARDAIGGAGTITIATANARPPENPEKGRLEPESWVMMSVTDTGHGMDTGTLERVFEPFFTTKEEGRGSGLGLASVYGIVAQHRGVIEVESQPGHGTVFRVYLPCAKDAGAS